MDEVKIKALRELGISQDVIDALLADVLKTEKEATADGVRYKGSVADNERALGELLTGGLAQVEDRLWELYTRGEFKAAAALASELLATAKGATVAKAYDVRKDPLAIGAGADQLRR